MRDVGGILNKVEGGDELLARLKAIQKSESKDFNKEMTQETDQSKVVKVELTLSNLLGQLGLLFD
jgi:hypothetical protein